MPARPSLIPSIRPSAPAEAPSVCVMKLGRTAVVISCPASLKKLAAPMLATPRVSQLRNGDCPVDLGEQRVEPARRLPLDRPERRRSGRFLDL